MADNMDMLLDDIDEERNTKLIKKVFQDQFEKQEQNLTKIIRASKLHSA